MRGGLPDVKPNSTMVLGFACLTRNQITESLENKGLLALRLLDDELHLTLSQD
jgi:hypothetical protein